MQYKMYSNKITFFGLCFSPHESNHRTSPKNKITYYVQKFTKDYLVNRQTKTRHIHKGNLLENAITTTLLLRIIEIYMIDSL